MGERDHPEGSVSSSLGDKPDKSKFHTIDGNAPATASNIGAGDSLYQPSRSHMASPNIDLPQIESRNSRAIGPRAYLSTFGRSSKGRARTKPARDQMILSNQDSL